MSLRDLPPHEWDDDAHREQIHRAFTLWFIAYDAGARGHAHRLKMNLKRLTDEAKLREPVLRVLKRQLLTSDVEWA